MRRIAARTLAILVASAAALPAAGVAATPPPLDLEVRHTVVSHGADGVTRTTAFRERVHRRADLVWIERVLPHDAHAAAPHGAAGHEGHAHEDLATAARWITPVGQGIRLRLVVPYRKLVLEVPEPDRAAVGFEGDWETSTRFITARALAAMTPSARPAPRGARWYERRTGGGTTHVLWDVVGEYPRRVESRSAGGAIVRTSVAERVRAPSPPPWTAVTGWAAKEYTDVLD
ncbi:hypothetical protein [Anaeromyxobacter dehalogenans]|uniref:Putative signal peptide protein n=1 Tax=Anaeromyxobacter dehalogenans (strain 2CP-C) TaxID=290397 RepID=Q2IPM5_ANADE|nr:hypothetical protein [Anaeromyxobacter dehalogenans]ABC80755.1 putative signal peptide protein [Anaeromyxobacter dehalogenans 2CP-C]